MSNRSQGLDFRFSVVEYMAASGLPGVRARSVNRLFSEMVLDGVEYGDALGIEDWTIKTRSHVNADVSGAVNEARSESGSAGTRWFATVQKRRGIQYNVEDAVVSMTLAQFAIILRDGLASSSL